MKFNKLVREDTQVQTIYDKPNAEGHLEQFDITAHEAPHPEMDKALTAVAPVCESINELKSGLTVFPYGITVSYTKHGTRKVSILFKRMLQATKKTYKFKTPSFQLDDPALDEESERECSAEQAQLIEAVISEGLRYAKGERLQTLLPLDEDPDSQPGEKDMFDGEEDEEDEDNEE